MSEGRATQYVRPLGWAALAGAPILLTALALVTSRPGTAASVVTTAAIAAWIAGTLAFGAALIHQRGGARAAKIVGALSAFVVVSFCGFLVWSSSAPAKVVLDARERAELVDEGGRLVHPHLGFSLTAPGERMRAAPEIAEEARRAGGQEWARAHRVWAWKGDESEVQVELSRVARADEFTLREGTRRIAAGLGEVGESASSGSTTLRAALPGGGTVVARVLVFERGGRGYRVLATVATRDPARWEGWLEGVEVP